ncbi:MAG TPA: hypothetical protein V6D23_18040 [Candidatus Obscuribacterales bacterium]
MPATQPQGLTDEQVEELLHALLDFRAMLLGLTDRFQTRMALLEQEFSERRTVPVKLETPRPATGSIRPAAPVQAPQHEAALEKIAFELSPEPETEAFGPDVDESFTIVDFDDDDDF